ncbi:MAG: cyclic pyranopterin monophosphate synthase MoaC [Candidatus Hydrogenedentes bacterium]|nr:cyclic pyranopterin monophosphate synthase MoaC [Candidatus Hydrogenedentota bacterium]
MLSHIDENGRPQMVDVGEKPVTKRTARARAIVDLPPAVAAAFVGGELMTKKGPVVQTAILAGVMAAKRTSELIPLCHPLGLDNCTVSAAFDAEGRLVVECEATVHARTGVEMEALTGASVAALTIYDMCKALSHEIVIRETRLISKTGGKNDYKLQS